MISGLLNLAWEAFAHGRKIFGGYNTPDPSPIPVTPLPTYERYTIGHHVAADPTVWMGIGRPEKWYAAFTNKTWNRVTQGQARLEKLEWLFSELNLGDPDPMHHYDAWDYRHLGNRSLSVGDVCIFSYYNADFQMMPEVPMDAWIVAAVGWQQLDYIPELDMLLDEVRDEEVLSPAAIALRREQKNGEQPPA